MPKNFQISQYDEPIASTGTSTSRSTGTTYRIEIERAHGGGHRQAHPRRGATGRIHGADYSLVDYNRAGIPLIEIVTKPIRGRGAARRWRGLRGDTCAT
jgi:aspartyl-tRNA(Asn)/glutamyl-tRNA(Gln) amidotransferase subunit B